MQVVYERCCGLDVHKNTVAACIAITGGGRVHRDKRVFGTTTKELLNLSDWLAEYSITHVGMESTAQYWKPIWNILEAQFDITLLTHNISSPCLDGRLI